MQLLYLNQSFFEQAEFANDEVNNIVQAVREAHAMKASICCTLRLWYAGPCWCIY
jgi:hypothetical protein